MKRNGFEFSETSILHGACHAGHSQIAGADPQVERRGMVVGRFKKSCRERNQGRFGGDGPEADGRSVGGSVACHQFPGGGNALLALDGRAHSRPYSPRIGEIMLPLIGRILRRSSREGTQRLDRRRADVCCRPQNPPPAPATQASPLAFHRSKVPGNGLYRPVAGPNSPIRGM